MLNILTLTITHIAGFREHLIQKTLELNRVPFEHDPQKSALYI